MKTLEILERGDKVKVEMIVESVCMNGGEVNYYLKDPRRMGKELGYPFKADQVELIESVDAEGENDG